MKVIFEMDVKEKWKKVKNYPYEVSNRGRVKRIETASGTRIGKILKPMIHSHGYLVINLCKNGKYKTLLIHRLVAEAFIGPCPKNKEVNHMDGDKENPYVKNLEYVTKSENVKHSFKLGLQKGMKGEKHPRSKLTNKNVLKIRKLYKTGNYIQEEIAKMFKVSQCCVSRILNDKNWN